MIRTTNKAKSKTTRIKLTASILSMLMICFTIMPAFANNFVVGGSFSVVGGSINGNPNDNGLHNGNYIPDKEDDYDYYYENDNNGNPKTTAATAMPQMKITATTKDLMGMSTETTTVTLTTLATVMVLIIPLITEPIIQTTMSTMQVMEAPKTLPIAPTPKTAT